MFGARAPQAELQVVERFMRYCFVMRERKMQTQRDMFGALGIGARWSTVAGWRAVKTDPRDAHHLSVP